MKQANRRFYPKSSIGNIRVQNYCHGSKSWATQGTGWILTLVSHTHKSFIFFFVAPSLKWMVKVQVCLNCFSLPSDLLLLVVSILK